MENIKLAMEDFVWPKKKDTVILVGNITVSMVKENIVITKQCEGLCDSFLCPPGCDSSWVCSLQTHSTRNNIRLFYIASEIPFDARYLNLGYGNPSQYSCPHSTTHFQFSFFCKTKLCLHTTQTPCDFCYFSTLKISLKGRILEDT